MKGNNRIWYIGYALSLLLIVMMFCNDFSKTMDMAVLTPKSWTKNISERI